MLYCPKRSWRRGVPLPSHLRKARRVALEDMAAVVAAEVVRAHRVLDVRSALDLDHAAADGVAGGNHVSPECPVFQPEDAVGYFADAVVVCHDDDRLVHL